MWNLLLGTTISIPTHLFFVSSDGPLWIHFLYSSLLAFVVYPLMRANNNILYRPWSDWPGTVRERTTRLPARGDPVEEPSASNPSSTMAAMLDWEPRPSSGWNRVSVYICLCRLHTMTTRGAGRAKTSLGRTSHSGSHQSSSTGPNASCRQLGCKEALTFLTHVTACPLFPSLIVPCALSLFFSLSLSVFHTPTHTHYHVLLPVSAKYADAGLSYADLYTLSGVTAIKAMGGPTIGWSSGRVDLDESYVTPDGRLPAADSGPPLADPSDADHLRSIFYRMGFDDREIVALSGAHALGRCHEDASGYSGPWTFTPTTFNNGYFRLLTTLEWIPKDWSGPPQYVDGATGRLMMLPTDLVLLQDRKFFKWVRKRKQQHMI